MKNQPIRFCAWLKECTPAIQKARLERFASGGEREGFPMDNTI
jgi:hypothetical protein